MPHLILTRRPGQGVWFKLPDGQEMRVGLEKNKRGHMCLHINAPANVIAMRDELHGMDTGKADGGDGEFSED